MIEQTIQTWHRLLETKDLNLLDGLLAEDVVFHSPVVHTPQEGKDLVRMYLAAAYTVFLASDFHYVREVLDGKDAALEFIVELDGITINGVDLIRCNDDGEIADFKVLIRPLKAIHLMHQKMGEMLQQFAPE